MRGRVFHPVGFVSAYLTTHHFEVPQIFTRCLNPLLKHVLPTLLILCYVGLTALYLGRLIEQAKQEHRQAKLDSGYVVVQGSNSK